jgi:hypothetical protein
MTLKAQILTVLSLVAFLPPGQAQTNQTATTNQPIATASAPQPPLSPAEQTIYDIKNPLPWMTWGGDFRARNEYFDNLISLTPNPQQSPNPKLGANAVLHEQDYFRFRARVWTSITPVTDLSLNTRLATEPREWMKPAGYTPYKGRSGLDMTEGIFDNLNVQWRNILKQPLTATVGRQDIFLGDGWLVGDGTPQDGSWTYFLDSARVTYELKEQHTTLEGIGIIQDAKDNAWLPPINFTDRYLTEQNEKGAILSVANSSIKAANVTGYFFYKEDDKASGYSPSSPPPPGGDDAQIYTVGGRLTGALGNPWKYSVEGAYQFGRKQDTSVVNVDPSARTTGFRDMDAFGANTRLTYSFKDKLNNQLSLSGEYLSGDNPNSKNDEMFDVLWGRWPRWSEIGLYSYAAETRVGQQANLIRFGPTWTINPTKKLEFNASYYALWAPEEVPTRGGAGLFSNSGHFRGHFAQAILKYKFSRHVSGHLWSEFLFPGNYYVSKTVMDFLRAEVMFTF